MKILTTGTTLSAIAMVGVLLTACDKDVEEIHDDLVTPPHPNTTVSMGMAYSLNGAAFDPAQTFLDAGGTRVKLNTLKFYLSQPSFTNDDGDTVASFSEKYLLFDMSLGNQIQVIGELDGHLHEMHVALGIDSLTNHSDPMTLPHPLNAPGLWWGWASGHLFLMMDGRFDSDGDDVVDSDFNFHCGMDTMYTPTDLSIHRDANMGGLVVLPFNLSIDSIFSDLNVAAHPNITIVDPITVNLMRRLKAGLTHIE
jgi:hypothetical protein